MNTTSSTESNRFNSSTTTTVAIFGASGPIGRLLLAQALAAGKSVRALTRRPEALEAQPGLTVIGGDVLDPNAVDQTLAGADAVIIALGTPTRDTSRLRTHGTQCIVERMQVAGIERMVCLSVLGAHESYEGLPLWIRALLFPLLLAKAVVDHEGQEDVIRHSGLRYTIVRPPGFRDMPATGEYAHGFGGEYGGLAMKIGREDLAAFMLAQLSSDEYVGQAVPISYRKGRAQQAA